MALALEGTPQHSVTNVLPGFTTSLPSQVFISSTINSATIASISGGGLTWTKRISNAAANPIELWTAQAVSALSSMVATITYSGSPSFESHDIFAFSGQDTSTKWDSNASVPGSLDVSPADPILVSTSNANDVIIACFRMASVASPTAGTGFTLISGADFLGSEYKIVSATQTNLSCGLGTGVGDSNGSVVDALMAASAGGDTLMAQAIF
jgi:hypothetical protein